MRFALGDTGDGSAQATDAAHGTGTRGAGCRVQGAGRDASQHLCFHLLRAEMQVETGRQPPH